MIALDELSRVGFGGYRISAEVAEHREALSYALDCGCNLVDTAASYTNGSSERLIGEVTASRPVFVMTKVGYVNAQDLDLLATLAGRGLPRDEILETGESAFCIHPDYISTRAAISRERLQRNKLDCLFLHNPERMLSALDPCSIETFLTRLREAFVRMEEMVADGLLRYYGVSSNSLVSGDESAGSISIEAVLQVLQNIGATHFKFVQFPVNLVERQAVQSKDGHPSLAERIREAGLVAVANRPLNAIDSSGPVRLATYDRQVEGINESAEEAIFADCMARIDRQLRRVGRDEQATDFSVVQFLRDGRQSVATPETVTQIFQTHFFPFIHSLYDGDVLAEDAAVFAKLEDAVVLFAKKANSSRARAITQKAQMEGRIPGAGPTEVAVAACEFVLNSGIPHVLVGMRRREYVEQMRPFFA